MTTQPLRIMAIAGETSGDTLAAELLRHLREEIGARGGSPPVCFGAGGARMAAEGVDLTVDLTAHSVIGLWEAVKNYAKFRRLFLQLLDLAEEQRPDLLLCVDFSGFNRRFAHAVKARALAGGAGEWRPRLVQLVSPQVWASRPDRAQKMAADFDLLLSIFPFEKAWYERHVPEFRVEFVGHPIFDRHPALPPTTRAEAAPLILLLPGSRVAELRRHLPPMLGAWRLIRERQPNARAAMVLPNEALLEQARGMMTGDEVMLQVGGLPDRLQEATVAIASTGTVTVECAFFGAPTVALYRTSWITYLIARQIVQVKYIAMPNILADAPVFPEFIQHQVTPENLATAVLDLLSQPAKRLEIQQRLQQIVQSLGGPGAARRAARLVTDLMEAPQA